MLVSPTSVLAIGPLDTRLGALATSFGREGAREGGKADTRSPAGFHAGASARIRVGLQAGASVRNPGLAFLRQGGKDFSVLVVAVLEDNSFIIDARVLRVGGGNSVRDDATDSSALEATCDGLETGVT